MVQYHVSTVLCGTISCESLTVLYGTKKLSSSRHHHALGGGEKLSSSCHHHALGGGEKQTCLALSHGSNDLHGNCYRTHQRAGIQAQACDGSRCRKLSVAIHDAA